VFTVTVSVSPGFYASVWLLVGVFTHVVFLSVACFFDSGEAIYSYVPDVSLCHVRTVILASGSSQLCTCG